MRLFLTTSGLLCLIKILKYEGFSEIECILKENKNNIYGQ